MRHPPAALLRARLGVLYLLSLAAVQGASLAWSPATLAGPLGLLGPPLVLALAALGGAAIHDRLAALLERTAMIRLRSILGLLYGMFALLAFVSLASGNPEAVKATLWALQSIQAAALLLAGFGRGYLGAMVNGLALTMFSALAGGPAAGVALAAQGGLLAGFLVIDHAARKLGEYPVDVLPPMGPILRRALVQGLLVGGGLAVCFLLIPPSPYLPLARSGALSGVSRDRLMELMGQLVGVAVLAAAAFYFVLRMGMGRGRDLDEARVEIVGARRRIEPRSVPRPLAGEDPGRGWRARIVKVYVAMSEQLARRGLRRRPDQTPLEFARKLSPADAARELTALFNRARYGPDELSESDFRAALAASQAILTPKS